MSWLQNKLYFRFLICFLSLSIIYLPCTNFALCSSIQFKGYNSAIKRWSCTCQLDTVTMPTKRSATLPGCAPTTLKCLDLSIQHTFDYVSSCIWHIWPNSEQFLGLRLLPASSAGEIVARKPFIPILIIILFSILSSFRFLKWCHMKNAHYVWDHRDHNCTLLVN